MGVYLFVQVRATPAQAIRQRATTPADAAPRAGRRGRQRRAARPLDAAATQAKPTTRGIQTPQATPDPGSASGRAARRTPPTQKVDLKSDNLMELANKAYDRQDFDEATAIAGKVLAKDPTNVRMLRIMVSASASRATARSRSSTTRSCRSSIASR